MLRILLPDLRRKQIKRVLLLRRLRAVQAAERAEKEKP
jgi:hypothetical protein